MHYTNTHNAQDIRHWLCLYKMCTNQFDMQLKEKRYNDWYGDRKYSQQWNVEMKYLRKKGK